QKPLSHQISIHVLTGIEIFFIAQFTAQTRKIPQSVEIHTTLLATDRNSGKSHEKGLPQSNYA
ncbi:hypothetical protein, partial [Synechococcus lacustris]|uniref:hypothetical protein n=1 Tax=Synechococcus lacustris TaxID=2116544 RepID=UPI0033427EEB